MTRERRWLVLVALLLVMVAVLLTLQVGHVAPVIWLLVPVFLFGAVELTVVSPAVFDEVRLPAELARPSLFGRPPPFLG